MSCCIWKQEAICSKLKLIGYCYNFFSFSESRKFLAVVRFPRSPILNLYAHYSPTVLLYIHYAYFCLCSWSKLTCMKDRWHERNCMFMIVKLTGPSLQEPSSNNAFLFADSYPRHWPTQHFPPPIHFFHHERVGDLSTSLSTPIFRCSLKNL